MLNRRLTWVAAMTVAAALLPQAGWAADSFYELYRLASHSDPSIKRSEAQLSSVRADIDVLDARNYPKVNGNLSYSQISQSLDSPGSASRGSTVNSYTYGVSGYVSIYDLRTRNALESVNFDIRSSEAQIAASRNDMISRFADAYFGVLKAEQDFQIASEEALRIKAILDQANAFLKAGTGDIISVHEAKARYDGMVADLNRYENNLTLARQRISLLVGRQVESVEDYRVESVPGPDPDDVQWWIEKLERNDPVLKTVKERIGKSAFDTEAAYSDYYPTFQAFAGYSVTNGTPFSEDLQSRQWNMGVAMTVPIYTGGEVAARIARSATGETELKYYLQEIVRQRTEFLKQLFYDLKYGVALVNSLKLRMQSAELQLTAVKKGRDIGTRTAIDLLNAEETYSVSQRDYKKAIYDNAVKTVMLKCLVGIVDENSIIPGIALGADPAGANREAEKPGQ